MVQNLYDVLLVEQAATLDEIKLAFKKRALQVHPDKGGSKEAFHLVYQALETLSDAQARRKYDHALASCGVQSGPVGKRRQKRDPVAKKRCQKPEKPPKFNEHSKPKSRKSEATYKTPPRQPPQCKQTQLLMKISELLKQLPRDVRSDVITKQFSQKQRLILENWMVENAQTQTEAGRQELAPVPPAQGDVRCEETRSTESGTAKPQKPSSCEALALQTVATSPEPIQTTKGRQQSQPKKLGCKGRKKAQSTSRVRGLAGCVSAIYKGSSYYKACILFDALYIYTGQCDLQTALEYLVILTSAKQKMLEKKSVQAEASFEERLEEALTLSANEQGKTLEDLNLRFCVFTSVGFFFGKFCFRSPTVRSIKVLGKLRSLLVPFRDYTARSVWSYSPVHLEEAWGRFQKVVAEAWEVAGADRTNFMKIAHARYNAMATCRKEALRSWEREHMAMQDKNQHRPKYLQDRSTMRCERWERQCMARQDKNKHRPRTLQEKNPTRCLENRERQHMALEDKNRHRPRRLRVSSLKSPEAKLIVLKRLLVRWENLLNQKVRSAEQAHLKALRKRKLQRKQDKATQRRLEVLNRKRIREKERLRRETLCKRMKSGDSWMIFSGFDWTTWPEKTGSDFIPDKKGLGKLPHAKNVAP